MLEIKNLVAQLEEKQIRKIRRDCERLKLLKKKILIPCNHLIDKKWTDETNEDSFVRTLVSCGLNTADAETISIRKRQLFSK